MRAALRSVTSYDVEVLSAWAPSGPSWSVGIRIIAGPDDEPGGESFDLTVCDLGWLASRVAEDGMVDGRHLLIMEWFDWSVLLPYIRRRVEQCEGATWREVAEKLARLGYWEFEDYDDG